MNWPHYDDEQVEAVAAVLRSGRVNYWTGEEGRAFEREYAEYLGRRHAIAVANGTVALELALEAFGIGAGDEVIVPARTYIATASCTVMRGAVPVVADIERNSGLITAETIEAALTPKTRAIIVVHIAGWPCEMDEIMALAERHKLVVIEDCAQAHGAFYKGRPVGALGHAAAFSFCQDKIMTTGGEGGLLALDDEAAWRRAWAFKDIGRSYEAVYEREHPPGFRWMTDTFGTNWRMTEMQATLGRIQLRRLPQWIQLRSRNAEIFTQRLRTLPGLRVPEVPAHVEHAWYRFYAFVDTNKLKSDWSRDRIVQALNERGVVCASGSCCEIHRERAFTSMGWSSPLLPVASELGGSTISFLVHPTLDAAVIESHASMVAETMLAAAR